MSKTHTYKYIIGIGGTTALIIAIVTSIVLWFFSSLSAQNNKQSLEDPRVKFAREHCTVDLNGDGKCNSIDTQLLRWIIGACKGDLNYNELADVDHDGCVTWRDQEQFFPMFVRDTSRQPCDLNGDGVCDRYDYEIYLKSEHMCFDNEPTVLSYECEYSCAYNPLADTNRDGCVLADDERILFPLIPERKSK